MGCGALVSLSESRSENEENDASLCRFVPMHTGRMPVGADRHNQAMRNRARAALGSELRALREERIPRGAAPGADRTKQEVLARLLADELGLSKRYDRRRVSDWERGAIVPQREVVIAYAQLYGKDPEEVEDVKRKLLRLWELAQRETNPPWWRTRVAVLLPIVALLGLLVALVVREPERPNSPRFTLHRFSKPDGRCRLNTRTDLPILRTGIMTGR